VAALAVAALGKDHVFGLHMPERESSPETLGISRLMADSVGIASVEEDITPVLEAAGCYRRRDEERDRTCGDRLHAAALRRHQRLHHDGFCLDENGGLRRAEGPGLLPSSRKRAKRGREAGALLRLHRGRAQHGAGERPCRYRWLELEGLTGVPPHDVNNGQRCRVQTAMTLSCHSLDGDLWMQVASGNGTDGGVNGQDGS